MFILKHRSLRIENCSTSPTKKSKCDHLLGKLNAQACFFFPFLQEPQCPIRGQKTEVFQPKIFRSTIVCISTMKIQNINSTQIAVW